MWIRRFTNTIPCRSSTLLSLLFPWVLFGLVALYYFSLFSGEGTYTGIQSKLQYFESKLHGLQYTGELQIYRINLKWIRIINSLYFKIPVNKNSYRFVIIKRQGIFLISKKAFTWKIWPFCFVFISVKNVNLTFYSFA